jgi:hypothetical protein
MIDAESMARISAAFSWAYRADTGQTVVAVGKLTDDELAECVEAAQRLTGWVHLQQLVRERQKVASGALVDAEIGRQAAAA